MSVSIVTTTIADVTELENRLSEPSPGAVETLRRLDGDILFLGAGGKMGPTLSRMARRASDLAGVRRRVIAVSRFGDSRLVESLNSHGIETIRCDLLDEEQVRRLPDAPNVVFMTGMKFGSTGQPWLTWAMNVFLPGMLCRKYRNSRVVAFSTGNVYPLTPVALGGSTEDDAPAPVGEYAQTALGRERILEYFSRSLHIPVVLLRLNYAAELRYGVIVDVARTVWAGEAVDLTMGCLNAIWQGDANAMALQAFDRCATPPRVLNLAGPEVLSVRRLAEAFGQRFGKPASFRGIESADALLSNGQQGHQLFGYPRVPARHLVEWVADWVRRGGVSLDKPTHFETRDGAF
jgi:nucleoside-diphosphate-sugar epimerase